MAKKILVAVFSASGVTRAVGQAIALAAGGDFFESVPKEPYSSDDLNWMNKQSRSTLEMNDKSARPVIASAVADMDSYDTVIVGFPIWWGVAPRIIETFRVIGKELAADINKHLVRLNNINMLDLVVV